MPVRVTKAPVQTVVEAGNIETPVGAVTPVTVVEVVTVAVHPLLYTVTPYVFIPATAVKVVVETVPLAPVPVQA